MPNSPSPLNYFLGSGNLYWTPDGGAERHLGNAIKFEVKTTLTKREHNSRMVSSRAVDATYISGQKCEVTAELEEITPENLAMAYLGTIAVNSGGNKVMTALAVTTLRGRFRMNGTNDIGSKYEVIVPHAELLPDGTFDFLAENEGTIVLNGVGTDKGLGYFTAEELSEAVTA